MFNQINSNFQGNVGLGAAIAYFTKRGCPVCVPLTDSQAFDLVVGIDGILRKIQVKTTSYQRKDRFQVDLRTKGGNRSGTGKTKKFLPCTIDYLFVLTSDNTCYLIPSTSLGGTGVISIGQSYDQFRV